MTMVISIARQSVIIKCLRQKSVLIGNYEFYYLAGLMEKLFQLGLDEELEPKQMFELISQKLDELHTDDEREKYLLSLVRFYEPLEEYDAQMKQLFLWGRNEADMWSVQTKYTPETE